MRIGYIYLFGEEWREWKKHNKSIPALVEELKAADCDKIYLDVFIEEYGLQEIERIDMKALMERISKSKEDDELIIRGKATKEKDPEQQAKIELKRIHNLHHRQI